VPRVRRVAPILLPRHSFSLEEVVLLLSGCFYLFVLLIVPEPSISVCIEAATSLPLSLLRNDSIPRSCSRAFWVFLLMVRLLFLLVGLVGVPTDRQGCSLMFLGVSIEGANERGGHCQMCAGSQVCLRCSVAQCVVTCCSVVQCLFVLMKVL